VHRHEFRICLRHIEHVRAAEHLLFTHIVTLPISVPNRTPVCSSAFICVALLLSATDVSTAPRRSAMRPRKSWAHGCGCMCGRYYWHSSAAYQARLSVRPGVPGVRLGRGSLVCDAPRLCASPHFSVL
jgi:hypothetical protein